MFVSLGGEQKEIKCKEHIDAALKQYWDHEKGDFSKETIKSSVQDLTKEDDSTERSNIKVAKQETAETEEDDDEDDDETDEESKEEEEVDEESEEEDEK